MGHRDVVIFDLGGVLIDWNPRYLYRKLFDGDEPAMEHFLATVCTQEWNRGQDAGRLVTDAARLLKQQHADKAELIDAFYGRFDEMMAGPINGTVDILAELHARGTPLSLLSNFSAETIRWRASASTSCGCSKASSFRARSERSNLTGASTKSCSIDIASTRIAPFSSTPSRRTSTRRDALGFTASNSSIRRRCGRNSPG